MPVKPSAQASIFFMRRVASPANLFPLLGLNTGDLSPGFFWVFFTPFAFRHFSQSGGSLMD